MTQIIARITLPGLRFALEESTGALYAGEAFGAAFFGGGGEGGGGGRGT